MSPPRTRLRALTFALAALGALSGCKKDDASNKAPPPAARPPAHLQNPYVALSTPLQVAPMGITLTRLNGQPISFGALANERIVVVVPWVRAQADALTRIASVRDSVAGLPGVRILPVLIEKSPSPERLAELSAQSEEVRVPFFVDTEMTLIKFLNQNRPRRPTKENVVSVPAYAVLTEDVRRITFAPKGEPGLRAILDEALKHPLPTPPPPMPPTEVSLPPGSTPAAAAP